MGKRIVIDPVTRIEGHAKITIQLDDDGTVSDARFHVGMFRGFESFCVGRPLWEMPAITSRICGICPVSHLLASAKACDAVLAVKIPPAADKLRRLMNLAQMAQSHATSFYPLSSPDFLLGFDCPPAERNIVGLAAKKPEIARGGIRLRSFGQSIIQALGGRKIHPSWPIPGGVVSGLSIEDRDKIRQNLPEAIAFTVATLREFDGVLDRYADEIDTFGKFPTLFMGLVTPEGDWEHHGGTLRVTDETGKVLSEVAEADYQQIVGEAVESDSYLKSPYYLPRGYPGGSVRVGPLARLNVCRQFGTPLADKELRDYRQRVGGVAHSCFLYHHARLIEILASLEQVGQLLDDPDLQSENLRAKAGINRSEGVGISEAPRGTLIHHYYVDEHGVVTKLNLIIATGFNNLAMNQTVAQVAKHYIKGPSIPEPMLNRVEASIRSFDPCLSCSTHAVGAMPMQIQLLAADGAVLDEARRD